MTLFDERERAFESLFAHDEELRFLALAKRNRLFGSWAAEQIGLRGAEYQSYVGSFVDCAVLPKCEEALITRVSGDLIANGVETSEARIRAAMTQAASRAAREVRAPMVISHEGSEVLREVTHRGGAYGTRGMAS
jgi:hypothetical protein